MYICRDMILFYFLFIYLLISYQILTNHLKFDKSVSFVVFLNFLLIPLNISNPNLRKNK